MARRFLFGLPLALTLSACALTPEPDQVAQQTMIGLSKREVLACMGRPVDRRAVAEATEIWTYPGVTTTYTPPWAAGLDFSTLRGTEGCDVRVVMTNAHVSQVSYGLPGGRGLPTGRQCSFPAELCASAVEVR